MYYQIVWNRRTQGHRYLVRAWPPEIALQRGVYITSPWPAASSPPPNVLANPLPRSTSISYPDTASMSTNDSYAPPPSSRSPFHSHTAPPPLYASLFVTTRLCAPPPQTIQTPSNPRSLHHLSTWQGHLPKQSLPTPWFGVLACTASPNAFTLPS